jgi:peptidoglycan hydrolase CwlO-like protein
MRESSRYTLGHYWFGGSAASNEREGDRMNRTFKLVTLGVLGAWLLTSTSCEDKVCNQALQTCKKEATDQRKECERLSTTISELKSQLTDTKAKVDSLSQENEELKAKSADAQAKGKSKGKSGKAKHKKKGKK